STISQIGPDSDERRERIDDLPKLGFGCPNVLGIPAECFRGTDTADVMTRLLLEHVTQQHWMCNYWMQVSHVTACRRRAAVAFLLKKRVARRPSHPRGLYEAHFLPLLPSLTLHGRGRVAGNERHHRAARVDLRHHRPRPRLPP